MGRIRLYPGVTKDMYRKPVIIQTEDLAEGVYTASGTGSAVWNKKSTDYDSWNKIAQVTFTITIPADYSGQHIKVSVVFDQAPTNAWGQVSGLARSGETINYDIYNAPASHAITAVVNGSDVNIVSVKVGKA